ncbi:MULTISPECIES: TauD/TfdA family dioxygenase [Streptomyces]|uniref:TauD/TfdA family dioxygenase n=1 Tax=Streptomyces sudanensis TaxID=436397 RepID=A0ABY4THD2_9ACTN|nr:MULTISPECIES: TauD/TfdA family dioxygenase [Streptomyces]URN17534.1 TauD/TfdA family dioxygenase [Streptomyces sudanensis]
MRSSSPTVQPAVQPAVQPTGAPVLPGVVPGRVPGEREREARTLLARDGAVVLTGCENTADALVVAAARVLGSGLRELYPHRVRTSRDGGPVHLHADSLDLVVDVGGVPGRRRHPDEDHVLIQCVRPAPSGGDSFAVDAYGFVDGLASADPALLDFLTGTDVDLYGKWAGLRGLPAAPRAARHVEYTRTGRRIVRRTDGAAPLHRDPDTDRVHAMLARFDEAVHALEPALPRFRLAEGDILVLDNYRCWHGRDAHTGERTVRILTLRTADAR